MTPASVRALHEAYVHGGSSNTQTKAKTIQGGGGLVMMYESATAILLDMSNLNMTGMIMLKPEHDNSVGFSHLKI
jgi:hypothetical protein